MSRNVEAFLHLFAGVEVLLKKRLGRKPGDLTSVSELIEAYAAKNPTWAPQAEALHLFREIRNLTTHRRNPRDGYPVLVPPWVIARIQEIHDYLDRPPRIGDRHRCAVETVAPTDPLADVLARAFSRKYSQFPVVAADGRFSGLITENAVTRWLGRQAAAGRQAIDMIAVQVRQVLREEETDRKPYVLQFARPEDPEDEVMGRFAHVPMLEVVLLTADGTKQTPLEGIVTQWDAARRSSAR